MFLFNLADCTKSEEREKCESENEEKLNELEDCDTDDEPCNERNDKRHVA